MLQPTSIINPILEQICYLASACKAAGIDLSISHDDNYISFICIAENVNRVIDLESEDAQMRLNSVKTEIQAILPVESAMGVAH